MKYSKDLLFPLSLALLEFGVFLSNDAYLPALPSMMSDLGLTQALSQSTLSIWFLGSASVQLFVGPLSDRFGRRPVLLLGVLAFILASVVCAIVENFQILLLARFVQGCTVCTTIVGGYASIHESFNGKRAIQIVAIMGCITILAPALGPLFGAYLVHITGHWQWIFYFLAVWVGVVGCFLFYQMPETLKKPIALDLLVNLKSYKTIVINYIGLT